MKKNILFIMTDQMHKYALGKVNPYVKTPNLDNLADSGTLFTNGYSNNPVCSPHRALLHTGLYSKDNGVVTNSQNINEGVTCLPELLHPLGYDSAFVGKLHIGDNDNRPVPREFWLSHNTFLGYQCHNGFLSEICFYDNDGKEHRYEGHRTDVTATLGIEQLRKFAEADKPFIETIFFQAPHYPVQPSPEFEAMYDGVVFPLPEGYEEIEPYTGTGSPMSPVPIENCPDFQRYGGNLQLYLKLYYGMVSQIDHNVGRIVDELERLGIADNTMIVFSADHGDMQGSHGMKNKCLPFERSCGVPFIVKIPGGSQVKTCETPVSTVDIFPTCLELADVKTDINLPGASLFPLVCGETTAHSPVYAEDYTMTRWHMLRNDNFKFVLDGERERLYLFDMKNDPDELENLIDNPAYNSVCDEMETELLNILK